jgi:hypothetical protein
MKDKIVNRISNEYYEVYKDKCNKNMVRMLFLFTYTIMLCVDDYSIRRFMSNNMIDSSQLQTFCGITLPPS